MADSTLIQTAGRSQSRRSWWFRKLWPRSLERQRLEAFLAENVHHFSSRYGSSDAWWVRVAMHLLDDARVAADRNDLQQAWASALGAARMGIFGYDQHEMAAARVALQHEAVTKLDSWRRKTVVELLSRKENLDDVIEKIVGDESVTAEVKAILALPPSDASREIAVLLRLREADYVDHVAMLLAGIAGGTFSNYDEAAERRVLFHATLIRDEHSQNVYRRIGLVRRQLVTVSLVLSTALATVLTLAVVAPIDLNAAPSGTMAWVWVFLFGVMGGCLTALLSVGSKGSDLRMPEQLQLWLITAARPLVGGAAALLAFVLFQAQILRLGPSDRIAGLLVVAFAAGFSERLVSRAVESVTVKGEAGSVAAPPATRH